MVLCVCVVPGCVCNGLPSAHNPHIASTHKHAHDGIHTIQQGCRTVDVGMPQLAMHSIREMCGVDDVALAQAHFAAFFK